MIDSQRIAVVLPAYNAEKTLEATVREVPDLVDIRILVDDHSSDRTVEVAKQLGLQYFEHNANYGYGRNQQTCYREALAAGADVVIMLHPDYQYTPLLVTAMAGMVAYQVYDVVLGSRILEGQALRGGMAIWKYTANRFLTAFENFFLGGQALRISQWVSSLQSRCAHPPCRCWRIPTTSSLTTTKTPMPYFTLRRKLIDEASSKYLDAGTVCAFRFPHR
jgi:glycosyltransferase involved in cell wall biosynthesis